MKLFMGRILYFVTPAISLTNCTQTNCDPKLWYRITYNQQQKLLAQSFFVFIFNLFFVWNSTNHELRQNKKKEITINIYNNYPKLKKIIEMIVLFVFSNGFISLVFIKMILKIIAEMLKKSESNKDWYLFELN